MIKRLSRQTVDFVISAGAECRAAYYTKRLNMRKFSSPCDWMKHYTLDDYLHVFETEGREMFQRAHIDTLQQGVVDEQNAMISLHDFKLNLPLEAQLPAFYKKMQRRAHNTIIRIHHSQSVGVVMHRTVPYPEIVQFAESLCRLFPHTRFHLVNFRDVPGMTSFEVGEPFQGERYTLQEVSFNDEHPDGRDWQATPQVWVGNKPIWLKLLRQKFYVKGWLFTLIRKKMRRRYEKILKHFGHSRF